MAALPSITTTTSPGIDVDLSRLLASLRGSMRENRLQAPLLPAVRLRLEQRQAALHASGSGAPVDQIEIEIAKLMMAYPSSRAAALADVKVTVRQYAMALEGVPLWALREVCSSIIRGAIRDLHPDFVPTAPRIRQLVDERTAITSLEARQIRDVLEAPVVAPDNPEMAARVKDIIVNGLRKRSDELAEFSRSNGKPSVPEGGGFKPPSWDHLAEVYKTRRLPGTGGRNVTVTDDVTLQDDRHAAGGQ